MSSEAEGAAPAAQPPNHDEMDADPRSGIWTVHMREVHSQGARVRGLRYYYEGGAGGQSDARGALVRAPLGSDGYVALVLQGIRAVNEETKSISTDLAHARDFLMSKRAWDSNFRGLRSCAHRVVPVLWVQEMRPARMCPGPSDILLGNFLCVPHDMESLACTLTLQPAASDPQGKTAWERVLALNRERLAESAGEPRENQRKRRRHRDDSCSGSSLRVVYTPRGALMGPVRPECFTGLHCKDAWVAAVQGAHDTVDIQAFCLSEPEILEELGAAARRGVVVRLRVDARQQDSSVLAVLLEEHGGTSVTVHPVVVSEDDERCHMHKKEVIVDGHKQRDGTSCLVTGSYNPTYRARFNQESALCVRDFTSVLHFAQRFEHDWSADRISERVAKDLA